MKVTLQFKNFNAGIEDTIDFVVNHLLTDKIETLPMPLLDLLDRYRDNKKDPMIHGLLRTQALRFFRKFTQEYKYYIENDVTKFLSRYKSRLHNLEDIKITLYWDQATGRKTIAWINQLEIQDKKYVIHISTKYPYNFFSIQESLQSLVETIVHETTHIIQFILKDKWIHSKYFESELFNNELYMLRSRSRMLQSLYNELEQLHTNLLGLFQDFKIEGEATHAQLTHLHLKHRGDLSEAALEKANTLLAKRLEPEIKSRIATSEKAVASINKRLSNATNDLLGMHLILERLINQARVNDLDKNHRYIASFNHKIQQLVTSAKQLQAHENDGRYHIGFLIVHLLKKTNQHKIELEPLEIIEQFIASKHMPELNKIKVGMKQALAGFNNVESRIKDVLALLNRYPEEVKKFP